MNLHNEPSFETVNFRFPAAVADALRRRVASHNWNSDRVAAAAILHFIEDAGARADMLRRLIEVQGGAPTQTPPQDVLEYHRDEVFGKEVFGNEVFGNEAEDMVTAPLEAICPPEATTEAVPHDSTDATITLDAIAANLACFNDGVIVDDGDDTPR